MSKTITIICDGCGTEITADTFYAADERANEGIAILDWQHVTYHYCHDCWKKMLATLK